MIRRARGLRLAKHSGNEDCILPGTMDILPYLQPTLDFPQRDLRGAYIRATKSPRGVTTN
jgi:hypothetical protein